MITEILTGSHQKNHFSCGYPALDEYLKKQAGQDMRRKLAVCFVYAPVGNKVIGYYTLSSLSIPHNHWPPDFKPEPPRSYTDLPVTLLGRLAVDQSAQGMGLGSQLLIDALVRSWQVAVSSIGSMAVFVDPIDEKARSFYQHLGFIPLPDSKKLFLPMKTIEKLVGMQK